MTYGTWLQAATQKLTAANIPSARLDALLLLEAATGQDRAHLLAHPEAPFQGQTLEQAEQWLARRLRREPVAYILGNKEFYGRTFTVTPDVLIPRPESEAFIGLLAKFGPLSGKHLLDVGTGSGALAITAKLENPRLQVAASDVSPEALAVAKQNAKNLGANVDFVESSLLTDISEDFDIIIANLPYVPPDYAVAPELNFEPRLALYADHGGLQLIEQFLLQTPGKLLPGGVVLIECLTSQHKTVKTLAAKASLTFVDNEGLILAFKK